MNIAIIGRTEILFETALQLHRSGHRITCIVTSKAAPEYTKTPSDFQALAREVSAHYAESARLQDQMEVLRDSRSDIGISVNFPSVIPAEAVQLFPLGILNAHGGDLPRYRGNACQAWAILNGESRIGLCIHKMIGGELDSGDIMARDYLSIDRNTKITKVWTWMTERTPELFLQAVTKLAEDPEFVLEQQSKDPSHALRCYPRMPEDGRIKWMESAENILRLINASNKPYPGAYFFLGDRKITIWDAEVVEDAGNFLAVPGQVTCRTPDGIDIACGQGMLRITLVQEGEQTCRPFDLIRSVRIRLF